MRRNILLTGGTRGLGLAIARERLQLGDRVWVVSRKPSAEWIQLCEQYPEQAEFLAQDLSRPSEIKVAVFEGLVGNRPLHGLVNNAAVAYDDLVSNLDLDRLDAMFQTNVFAAMELTKLTIRNMLLHSVSGSIVHVSSLSTHTGYKGLAMYAASKGAIEAFSKNVAREWGSRGIRSNCVVPGFMETDMSAGLSPEQLGKIHARTALKQATDPASVASMVSHLLSDASRSVTGQAICVDAGAV